MAYGGSVTCWGGSKAISWQNDINTACRIRVNKRGAIEQGLGQSTLANPRCHADVCEVVQLKPNIDMVHLLLSYGAYTTETALVAARASLDPALLTLLENHTPFPAKLSPVSSPLAITTESTSTLRSVGSTNFAAVSSSTSRPLESLTETLLARIASLESDNATLLAKLAVYTSPTVAATAVPVATQNVPTHPIFPSRPNPLPEAVPVGALMFAHTPRTAQSDDEIDVANEDRIFVEVAHGSGWGSGLNTTTGLTGLFPFSILAANPPKTVSSPSSTATSTIAPATTTKTSSVGVPGSSASLSSTGISFSPAAATTTSAVSIATATATVAGDTESDSTDTQPEWGFGLLTAAVKGAVRSWGWL
ncbi:hypothetical protein HDU93_001235 [Gonapodya sp. JEL0774]|nr:hypothetical protein HDU93_001235 [Gonapodya sp. JEL0774]